MRTFYSFAGVAFMVLGIFFPDYIRATPQQAVVLATGMILGALAAFR